MSLRLAGCLVHTKSSWLLGLSGSCEQQSQHLFVVYADKHASRPFIISEYITATLCTTLTSSYRSVFKSLFERVVDLEAECQATSIASYISRKLADGEAAGNCVFGPILVQSIETAVTVACPVGGTRRSGNFLFNTSKHAMIS